jgi:AraC family transcriptional regulator, regulatory protein of adaptative response / methylated-DNA-[protein]-cysteine methyltransferase
MNSNFQIAHLAEMSEFAISITDTAKRFEAAKTYDAHITESRCPHTTAKQIHSQKMYNKIRSAIEYLIENQHRHPRLDEVAGFVHVSEYHFQRMFSEWAGVSPKKFLKYLTIQSLKQSLRTQEDLATATDQAGLSSTSRLHDLFVTMESCTPAEYRSGGEGLVFEYGFADSVFGDCFVAGNDRGIAAISFADGDRDRVLEEFTVQWPKARCIESSAFAESQVARINQIFMGHTHKNPSPRFHVLVKGTPFQIKVWEALLRIPAGSVTSYQQLAQTVGNPKASRAVGSAVGKNPISWLIPCHRVIRQEGVIGNYHWDPLRKTAMLGVERARRYQESDSDVD